MDRLPPYMFKVVDKLKIDLRREGVDIVDLGMGNPDIPTPATRGKLIEAAENSKLPVFSVGRHHQAEAGHCGLARGDGADIDPEEEAIATIGAKEALPLCSRDRQPRRCGSPNPTYPFILIGHHRRRRFAKHSIGPDRIS
jgi:alanine-synthesizing transaminase